MLPRKEPKGPKLKVDLVAKVVGPLAKDLGLYLVKGLHKEL